VVIYLIEYITTWGFPVYGLIEDHTQENPYVVIFPNKDHIWESREVMFLI